MNSLSQLLHYYVYIDSFGTCLYPKQQQLLVLLIVTLCVSYFFILFLNLFISVKHDEKLEKYFIKWEQISGLDQIRCLASGTSTASLWTLKQFT